MVNKRQHFEEYPSEKFTKYPKITISNYQMKEGTGKVFDIKEKIIIPVTIYFSNAKRTKLKVTFHITPIMENITLGNDFIFNGPKSTLTNTSLTINDGCSIKLKSVD